MTVAEIMEAVKELKVSRKLSEAGKGSRGRIRRIRYARCCCWVALLLVTVLLSSLRLRPTSTSFWLTLGFFRSVLSRLSAILWLGSGAAGRKKQNRINLSNTLNEYRT